MRVAIDLVKEGEAHACVSAGNTGALMATARFVLKMLPGIDRPAICTSHSHHDGHTRMLDLGANVDCTRRAPAAVRAHGLGAGQGGGQQSSSPRVGLLNIGEEEIKGNEQVKEAARLLCRQSAELQRLRRGRRYLQGQVDVVVCDGFVGNVALKTSEGVASMIAHFISAEFRRNALTRLAGAGCHAGAEAFRQQDRSATLQRRQPAGAAGHRHQEPRRRRCARLRQCHQGRDAWKSPESVPRTHQLAAANPYWRKAGGLNHARIIGTGGYLPEKVLTNDDLEKMVDTNDPGSANAPGSASAISPPPAKPPAIWPRAPRAAHWRRPGATRATST